MNLQEEETRRSDIDRVLSITAKTKKTEENRSAYLLGKTKPRHFRQSGKGNEIHAKTMDQKRMMERTSNYQSREDLTFLASSIQSGAIITGIVKSRKSEEIYVEEEVMDENGNVRLQKIKKPINLARVEFTGPSGTSYQALISEQDFFSRKPSTISVETYLSRRIGSEVDFVLMEIYENGKPLSVEEQLEMKLFRANRKLAMEILKKEMWFATNTAGKTNKPTDYMFVGKRCSARVVSVSTSSLVVELCGVETVIPTSEARWLKTPDLNEYFIAGDDVEVILTKIDKEIVNIDGKDTYKVFMQASIKQTTEDPRIEAARRCSRGEEFIGKVTKIGGSTMHDTFVIVQVDEATEIRCDCKDLKVYSPILGDLVRVVVNGVDYEKSRIFGTIMRREARRRLK